MRGRAIAVGALVLLAVGIGFALWPRGDPPAPRAQVPDPCLDAPQRGEFVNMLAAYLQFGSRAGERFRSDLVRVIAERRDVGCDPLADTDEFLRMLYAARPFDRPIESYKVVAPDVHQDPDTGITSVALEWGRFALLLPSAYPKDARALGAHGPYPMIVSLHDLEDVEGKEYPGEALIRRRYPKATSQALLDAAIVYAPVAIRAKFSVDGAIDGSKIASEHIWRRYHVDFDRMVIDGGNDALLFAAAHAVFYAGVIVRGDAADVDPAVVRNFAHRKVYVVGTDGSAARKSLLAGGMPAANVTVGTEAGLGPWIKGLEGTTPTSFEWIVKDRAAHRLAHWVNITVIEPGPEPPTLKVDRLDTKDDPNTVRIETKGVRGLSVFLNDRILDLDRPVRIVVDGKPLPGATLLTGRPRGKLVRLPAKLDRKFDVMLDVDRDLSVRRSRYYAFLFPVILDAIEVPVGGPQTKDLESRLALEDLAQEHFAKAKELQKRGEVVGAREWAQKAIDVGDTAIRSAAEGLVESLDSAKVREAQPRRTR